MAALLHDAHVGLHLVADVRPLHLDHHLGAVVQRGLMHLGRRGGGERLRLEGGVELLRGLAQLLDDDFAHLAAGEGRHVALQLRQLRLPLRRDDRGLAGDDLPHLDVGGAQLLDHQAHLDRRGHDLQVLGQIPYPSLQLVAKIAYHGPARAEADVQAVAQKDVVDLLQAQVFTDFVDCRCLLHGVA